MSEKSTNVIRKYLFDVAKIVEGAANADMPKVVAYCQQLSDRLLADGEVDAAKRVKQIIGHSKGRTLGMSRAGATSKLHATPIPVDTETRLSMADEEHFDRGDVALFLNQDVDQQVSQFLQYVRAADRLVASGVGISPSMLMFGPPGCGKTLLAKHVAAELNLPLITARTDGLISSYLGSTSKNIRLLFEHAASRPCVLFLDEFDAMAKMRDDTRELGELKRVVISLLQNIDAMGTDHVLLAATNHEHLLDPAIWRRFTYSLRLAEPNADVRVKMLAKFMGGYAHVDHVEVLAALSEGLTGAQLKLMADNAIRAAVLADRVTIDLPLAIHAVLTAAAKSNDKNDMSLSEQLNTIRRIDKKKFTQQKLASMLGMSQPRISQLLKGSG